MPQKVASAKADWLIVGQNTCTLGSEICVLKLCAWKTPSCKSGHIRIATFENLSIKIQNELFSKILYLNVNNVCIHTLNKFSQQNTLLDFSMMSFNSFIDVSLILS